MNHLIECKNVEVLRKFRILCMSFPDSKTEDLWNEAGGKIYEEGLTVDESHSVFVGNLNIQ